MLYSLILGWNMILNTMHTIRIIPCISFIILVLLISCNSNTAENQKDLPFMRNVVVIIGDDHATGVLGSLGNKIIRTPNLDKLSSEGILFTNAFANAPLCSASRQSLLTGKYPHAAGVTLLTTPFPEEQVTLADHLKQFGFRSAIIGKNHFNNDFNHGFDVKIERKDYYAYLEAHPPLRPPDSISVRPPWRPFRDHARIWLNAEALPSGEYDDESIGTYYARKAVEFINSNQENRFLLWIGFHEPHSPFNFPVEYAGKYNPEDMPLPIGSPEDDEFIPLVFKDLTEGERRGIISAYYTSVEYLDKNIGLVLEGLENAGLAENTLVIYLGDHGYLLNDHKRFEKHMMWEEAVKAPLIIRAGSGNLVSAISDEMDNPASTNQDELVEFIDVVPTITDMLGLEGIPGAQGKSLTPLFQEQVVEFRDIVFSEFLADNKAMVRTKKWKYIFTTGKRDLAQGYETGNPPKGLRHRLYDLEADPKETTDVSGNPENQDILRELQKKMVRVFQDTHPNAGNMSEDLDIEQQLVWFCEPPDKNPDINAK